MRLVELRLSQQFGRNGELVMGIIDDISGWVERLKRFDNVAQEVKHVELIETIHNLRLALVDWKGKFADLADENFELKAKVKKLEQQVPVADELVFRDGVYYRANPVQGKPEGPFCPMCWETGKLIVSLNRMDPLFSFAGRFQCPKCQANIT